MLMSRVLRHYPSFGVQLVSYALSMNKMDVIDSIEQEYLQEMDECEELGSSDLAAFTWNFAREVIITLRLPFEGVVKDGRYEIIRKEVVS